jgi:hypothetical protein
MTALSLSFPTDAFAACTNPAREDGAIIYNEDQNVPQVCAGGAWVALGVLNPAAGGGSCTNPARTEGAIVYNVDYTVLQYCDGTNWIAVQAASVGGCTAPASCPNVGDVCSDGSLFAGFVLYSGDSCEPLYVTDNNQSTASQWKNATGTDDISTDDPVDGKINAANRGGNLSDFPVFDLCESNTYHGKSDWYLPARAELNLLWLNRAAIDANAAENFTASYYWSSTEHTTMQAWYKNYGYGGQEDDASKTDADDVRCVRRD